MTAALSAAVCTVTGGAALTPRARQVQLSLARRASIERRGAVDAAVPMWNSREHFLADVRASVESPAFVAIRETLGKRGNVSAAAVIATAEAKASFADHATGRNSAASLKALAALAKCSERTISSANAVLAALGLAIEAQRGHGSATGHPAGNRTSIWHLVSRPTAASGPAMAAPVNGQAPSVAPPPVAPEVRPANGQQASNANQGTAAPIAHPASVPEAASPTTPTSVAPACFAAENPDTASLTVTAAKPLAVDSCDLPPLGGLLSLPHVGKYSPNARARAENSCRASRGLRRRWRATPRPIAIQRLAAELVTPCGSPDPRLRGLDQGHIGTVCDALLATGIDPKAWTAKAIKEALDADMRASGWSWPDRIHNPGGFIASRLRRLPAAPSTPQPESAPRRPDPAPEQPAPAQAPEWIAPWLARVRAVTDGADQTKILAAEQVLLGVPIVDPERALAAAARRAARVHPDQPLRDALMAWVNDTLTAPRTAARRPLRSARRGR